ncbi:MAG: hypothetical protein HY303_08585 [Candidatus Wallbacteria bacterium]|nr:hypothetical protein [Candidatus Wallbacteria bacterium]
MVRPSGETLNFDDVIRTVGDKSQRLESYDLRWVNGNRVTGDRTFPVVHEKYVRDMSVKKENLPWSSGYWPFVWCRLSFGRSGSLGLSPLEKYDSYVLSQSGKLPAAAAWEANPANKHNYFQKAFEKPADGIEETKPREKRIKMTAADGSEYEISGKARYGWFGHCNGWAAAACLVPQPPEQTEVKLKGPLKAARLKYGSYAEAYDLNGEGEDQYVIESRRERTMVFTRPDMKGLLTESFMDCIADMTHPIIRRRYLERNGVRDRGYVYEGITLSNFQGAELEKAKQYLHEKGGEEFKDIYPHNFHRICLDYLGQRNQAFVTEVDADNAKDNHPTYGYKYVQNFDESKREYTFEAEATYATYAPYEFDGPKALPIKYSFRMKLDDRNRIVASEWTGSSEFAHPDFVWVPQSNAPPGKYENKNLDYAVLQEIMAQSGTTDEDRPVTQGVQGNGSSVPAGPVVEPDASTSTAPPAPAERPAPDRGTGRQTPRNADFGGASDNPADERIRSDTDGQ